MKLINKILFISSLLVVSAFADTMLVEGVKTDNFNINQGVPVKKVGDKVEVEGYAKGNDLYATKNMSLVIATVKDAKIFKKDGEKSKIVFATNDDNLSDDYLDAWEDREDLYLEKCSQCHAAHEASEHTMLEWEGLYGSMKGFAQPTPEEEVIILTYLKTFAKDGIAKAEE